MYLALNLIFNSHIVHMANLYSTEVILGFTRGMIGVKTATLQIRITLDYRLRR